MILLKKRYLVIVMILLSSCNKSNQKVEEKNIHETFGAGTFGYDLDFLRGYDSAILLLQGEGDSRLIISPKYQGKVFTSTTGGNAGQSFGWINYKAFSAPIDPHMNAYGGENRFWLGPEGGVFSLFFEKGTDMVFENWKTPSPIDTEQWSVVTHDDQSVVLKKDMDLANYTGAKLTLSVDRKISILDRAAITDRLGLPLDSAVKSVGYVTDNTITNRGENTWTEKTGMPCIWMLDMFKPSPATTIIIPYNTEGINPAGKIATTDYFGEIPPDRIRYKDGVLFFKADGNKRSKLGINPLRAKSVAGSYDAQNHVLTVTLFDVDPSGKYLNQEWNTKKPPFSGDAVNAYNDGPLDDGSIMGPFYEIESVSPAAFLKPGESLSHQHMVIHLTGDESALGKIMKEIFGVSNEDVDQALP
ncbi:MAG TPA: DUF6786 family protein [Cyclobacteriaceae bacterium]|nr:DUF6786 family protein [Cyclobacteriaceae bacterium]